MYRALKNDWKLIIVQSVVSAVMIIALAWGLSALLGSAQRNARIDDATKDIIHEVRAVKLLICETLSEADNIDIVRAVGENC